jgi:hypothetical protein
VLVEDVGESSAPDKLAELDKLEAKPRKIEPKPVANSELVTVSDGPRQPTEDAPEQDQ